jgi:hypothetical protein
MFCMKSSTGNGLYGTGKCDGDGDRRLLVFVCCRVGLDRVGDEEFEQLKKLL